MKWEMEMEEIEAVLERIWDLHDKISDTIHAISRADFLKSTKNLNRASPEKKQSPDGYLGSGGGEEGSCGYVFMKGFRVDEVTVLAEAKCLNAISTALENLGDQLKFFHNSFPEPYGECFASWSTTLANKSYGPGCYCLRRSTSTQPLHDTTLEANVGDGTIVARSLPGLIDEIMSKGKCSTYEELCDADRPYWHSLRKSNGERYAYSSHSQAILDCLSNRSEWAHLIDRGPK